MHTHSGKVLCLLKHSLEPEQGGQSMRDSYQKDVEVHKINNDKVIGLTALSSGATQYPLQGWLGNHISDTVSEQPASTGSLFTKSPSSDNLLAFDLLDFPKLSAVELCVCV